jgi:hypothetical protein
MRKLSPLVEVSNRPVVGLQVRAILTNSSYTIKFNEIEIPLAKCDLLIFLQNLETLIQEIRHAHARLDGYQIALDATDAELDKLPLARASVADRILGEAATKLRLGGTSPVVPGSERGTDRDPPSS